LLRQLATRKKHVAKLLGAKIIDSIAGADVSFFEMGRHLFQMCSKVHTE
jgi:hypothetical protein